MRFVSRFATVAALSAILTAQAAAVAPPCPEGLCPGLGKAFYLPVTNLLDAKANSGGRAVFKDTRIGSCATQVDHQEGFRSFRTHESASQLTESLNNTVEIKAGFPVQQVNIGGTVNATTGHQSVQTGDFKSVVLDIASVNLLIDFDQSSRCLFPDNLDPNFQAAFEALALPSPEQAGESFTWAGYTQFLQNWGSHVQVQQQIGSRVQQWVSSKTGSTVSTDTLKAKACFELEGFTGGWSARPCAIIDAGKRYEASTQDTNNQRYIAGGTAATRTALLRDFNEKNLQDFIDAAHLGDQPVAYRYLPLWSVLQEVYRAPCGQAGKDSAACKNLQRAVALQAAYEGFGAYACNRQVDGRNAIIQTLRAQGPDSLGIYYFACHQSKTGCRENSDCKVYPGELAFQCYCEGPGCIDASAISGILQRRNFVRGEAEYDYWDSDKGVNASCQDKILSCNCDEGWSGGPLARDIWDQALSGTGARVASGRTAASASTASAIQPAEVEPPEPNFYTLHVDVGTQEILTPAEARRAEKAAQRAEALGDTRHNRVWSEPAGIDCPGLCEAAFPRGITITLRYEENLDHQFVEWTGTACYKRTNQQATRGKTCLIESMGEEKRVGAVFRIAPK